MAGFPNRGNKDLSITVAGNTGNVTFTVNGEIRSICFQAPANAVYTYEITDAAGYGIAGAAGLQGNTTEVVNVLCTISNAVLTLTNATNGAYSIRLYMDYST